MVDTTQILLYIVVSSLTVLLVVIGIQVFFILREVRMMIRKMNKMIDDASMITGSITRSVSEVAGFTTGLKTALNIFHMLSKKREKKNHE